VLDPRSGETRSPVSSNSSDTEKHENSGDRQCRSERTATKKREIDNALALLDWIPNPEDIEPNDDTFQGFLLRTNPEVMNYEGVPVIAEVRNAFALSPFALELCLQRGLALALYRYLMKLVIERSLEQVPVPEGHTRKIQCSIYSTALEYGLPGAFLPEEFFSIDEFMQSVENAMEGIHQFGTGENTVLEVRVGLVRIEGTS
jgi:hypothetical protein